MRLIDTQSLKLHHFFGANIPPQNPPRWVGVYDEEEAAKIKAKSGYVKIQSACQQAHKDGLLWLWVDTNCIDKTSEAELSEAINSMYGWYGKAEVCYAFLADVPTSQRQADYVREGSEFRRSRWFSRGWTLQELLAPRCLVLFTNSWARIGDKKEMAETIREITGIPDSAIVEPEHIRCGGFGHFNAATMMSWASKRETTVVEDRAYCLMGLFRINMPLLYGEGDQAFLRLQLEITQKRNDPTLLAWQNTDSTAPRTRRRADGIVTAWLLDTFAKDPACFRSSNNCHPTECAPGTESPSSAEQRHRMEMAFSRPVRTTNIRLDNIGLALRLPLVETLR